MTLRGHGKFGEKLPPGFQFNPGKILLISLKQARRVKISKFMGLFCLKGTLVQLKIAAGASSCDNEVPWKV